MILLNRNVSKRIKRIDYFSNKYTFNSEENSYLNINLSMVHINQSILLGKLYNKMYDYEITIQKYANLRYVWFHCSDCNRRHEWGSGLDYELKQSHYHPLAQRRTKNSLSSFVQFWHDNILCLSCSSLCGKVNKQRFVDILVDLI